MDPTTAQVTGEVPTTQPEVQQQNPGLQARIDELVARAKSAEQANQELMQRMMEQNAQLLQAQRPAPQATPDPLQQHAEALDPRLVQVLQAERERMEAIFRQKMAQVEAQQGLLAIQSQASQSNVPAEVTQRAQALYQQAKQNGFNPSPDEAFLYALGGWYLQQQKKGAQVVGLPTTAFNPPSAVPPSVNVMPQQQSRQAPADFESWPLNKQLAYMEQQGFGNEPL